MQGEQVAGIVPVGAMQSSSGGNAAAAGGSGASATSGGAPTSSQTHVTVPLNTVRTNEEKPTSDSIPDVEKVVRRRERNKELARKSRQKKKVELEQLHLKVQTLTTENRRLVEQVRMMQICLLQVQAAGSGIEVQSKLGISRVVDEADKVLASVAATEQMIIMSSASGGQSAKLQWPSGSTVGGGEADDGSTNGTATEASKGNIKSAQPSEDVRQQQGVNSRVVAAAKGDRLISATAANAVVENSLTISNAASVGELPTQASNHPNSAASVGSSNGIDDASGISRATPRNNSSTLSSSSYAPVEVTSGVKLGADAAVGRKAAAPVSDPGAPTAPPKRREKRTETEMNAAQLLMQWSNSSLSPQAILKNDPTIDRKLKLGGVPTPRQTYSAAATAIPIVAKSAEASVALPTNHPQHASSKAAKSVTSSNAAKIATETEHGFTPSTQQQPATTVDSQVERSIHGPSSGAAKSISSNTAGPFAASSTPGTPAPATHCGSSSPSLTSKGSTAIRSVPESGGVRLSKQAKAALTGGSPAKLEHEGCNKGISTSVIVNADTERANDTRSLATLGNATEGLGRGHDAALPMPAVKRPKIEGGNLASTGGQHSNIDPQRGGEAARSGTNTTPTVGTAAAVS